MREIALDSRISSSERDIEEDDEEEEEAEEGKVDTCHPRARLRVNRARGIAARCQPSTFQPGRARTKRSLPELIPNAPQGVTMSRQI